ncbi:hypothetical protein ACJX0J_027665, partial [Zea mays]
SARTANKLWQPQLDLWQQIIKVHFARTTDEKHTTLMVQAEAKQISHRVSALGQQANISLKLKGWGWDLPTNLNVKLLVLSLIDWCLEIYESFIILELSVSITIMLNSLGHAEINFLKHTSDQRDQLENIQVTFDT